jgi:hypothetical protein
MVDSESLPMMRCLQCDRDYPESARFCHQCGEPLHRRDDPVTAGWPIPPGRSRALSRHRAAPRTSSLLFATLVVVGAGAGLALVWRQAWMPSLARVIVSPARQPNQAQPDTVAPPQAQATAPGRPETLPAAPAPMPAPEPTADPAPPPARTPESAPTAGSLPSTAPAPESAPVVVSPSPPSRRAPERAARVASRQDPPAATAERPPSPGVASSRSATTPRLLSARTDPGTSVPSAGARVISLVPVGPAAGARGQLLWEPIGGGVLVVSGLPQPPVGQTYQLWLGSINLGSRVSAGLLAVDAQGAGTLRVAPPRATWSPDIFGVTMERKGGAREPSDDLVLVGELASVVAAAPSSTPQPLEGAGGGESLASSPTAPSVTASVSPPTSSRGPDGQLVRVFPASVDRTWTAAQSALRSLGWDIDRADQATGVIRTEPRNMIFKDWVLYAKGTRHTVDVVVRAVSDDETSISVKRDVFQEQRIFWAKERKALTTPESSLEQTILDAIERLL